MKPSATVLGPQIKKVSRLKSVAQNALHNRPKKAGKQCMKSNNNVCPGLFSLRLLNCSQALNSCFEIRLTFWFFPYFLFSLQSSDLDQDF